MHQNRHVLPQTPVLRLRCGQRRKYTMRLISGDDGCIRWAMLYTMILALNLCMTYVACHLHPSSTAHTPAAHRAQAPHVLHLQCDDAVHTLCLVPTLAEHERGGRTREAPLRTAQAPVAPMLQRGMTLSLFAFADRLRLPVRPTGQRGTDRHGRHGVPSGGRAELPA